MTSALKTKKFRCGLNVVDRRPRKDAKARSKWLMRRNPTHLLDARAAGFPADEAQPDQKERCDE